MNDLPQQKMGTTLTQVFKQGWPYRKLIVIVFVISLVNATFAGSIVLVIDGLLGSWGAIGGAETPESKQAAIDESFIGLVTVGGCPSGGAIGLRHALHLAVVGKYLHPRFAAKVHGPFGETGFGFSFPRWSR